MLVDYVKHFYLTKMNKMPIFTYNGMRNDIFRKVHLYDNPRKLTSSPKITLEGVS